MRLQCNTLFCLLATLVLAVSCGKSSQKVYVIELLTDGNEIVWDDNSDARLVTDGDTVFSKVHFRGGYSSRYPKHSLAIKTSYDIGLCNLPDSRSWVLNASYIDRTFMRHKLAYDIFRSMDSHNRAPLCAYVWLSVDGAPQGLYVAMQRLNANTLGLSRTDSCSVVFKEPPLLYPTPPVPQDSTNPFNQKYPKLRRSNRSAQHEFLRQLIFDSDDETFAKQAPSMFDLNNIADWHLLIQLANNSDGVLKGYYLYKTDCATPWRVAPWDYDHAFGRDGDGEMNMLERTVDCDRSVLLHRLMQLPEYRELLRARWQRLRESGIVGTERINSMIDVDGRTIRRYVKKNAELWPVDAPEFYDTMDFGQELTLMRQFFEKNITRLDSIYK